MLKPIYVWLAPTWPGRWSAAKAAITQSDNDATDEVVGRIGGLDRLTRSLSDLAGVDLPAPETWGRVLVTDTQIAAMYTTLLAISGQDVTRIVKLMRAVVPTQRFTVPPRVPVKAGWDLQPVDGVDSLITRIVRIDQGHVTARTTVAPVDPTTANAWRVAFTAGGPDAVIRWHLPHAPSTEDV